jgi:hypothetical protein
VSDTRGVGQPASNACVPSGNAGPRNTPVLSESLALRAITVSADWFGSIAQGVAQPAIFATCPKSTLTLRPSGVRPSAVVPSGYLRPPFGVRGVGQPESAVADVRRTEARRRKRDTPEGVIQGFQVSLYKVDPRLCTFVCNLFASDDDRFALADEPFSSGPQVPLVSKPLSFACRAERLAWARTGPDRLIVGPASLAQGVGPYSSASEEVHLRIPGKLIWSNVTDIPLIDDAGRYGASGDGLADGLRGEWIDLVVKGGAHATPANVGEAGAVRKLDASPSPTGGVITCVGISDSGASGRGIQ